MKIKYSEFITSATKPNQYPIHPVMEVAFIGKSNVGKSSLINMLLERKKLAKVSATPGKTTLINFFDVNGELSFVDLPGYGYASRSKKEQQNWANMIETYLSIRENLSLFFLLLDIRRIPSENDMQILTWLQNYAQNYALILTKADKLNQKEKNKQIKKISEKLQVPKEDFYVISSLKRSGKEKLLNLIGKNLEAYNQTQIYMDEEEINEANTEINETNSDENNEL